MVEEYGQKSRRGGEQFAQVQVISHELEYLLVTDVRPNDLDLRPPYHCFQFVISYVLGAWCNPYLVTDCRCA